MVPKLSLIWRTHNSHHCQSNHGRITTTPSLRHHTHQSDQCELSQTSYSRSPPATAPAVAAASVSYPYRSGTFHLLTDVHLSQRELSGGTVLLVDRTGGGKSHTMRCSGVFTRGIAVIIVPLLALAADERQSIHCDADGGYVVLSFRDSTVTIDFLR